MKEMKSNYCEHCGEFHDEAHEYPSQVKVGEAVPDLAFEAYHRGRVEALTLSALRGSWLALVFYPADFSSVCPTELAELAALYLRFKRLGAEIVSVSSDTVYAHKAWQEADPQIAQIEYPMAADPSGKLAYAFGVLIEGGEPMLTENEGLAQRGTFLIDPAGVLRAMEISDSAVGRSAAETLRKLEALQYVESHKGATCPASWEPGEKAIEPARKGK
ncbi:MAG TPA: redoxin domain-containing protein [Candidatus Paceibacterota bacterium]|nr:redoxin domain-containing protein [Candidatus Paceibacterota bacterium]